MIPHSKGNKCNTRKILYVHTNIAKENQQATRRNMHVMWTAEQDWSPRHYNSFTPKLATRQGIFAQIFFVDGACMHGRTAQLQRSALKCHGRALRDISELRLPSIGWTQYPLPIHCPDQINAIPIKWQWSAEARRLKCDWIWFVICSIQSMCDNFWKRTEQTGATTIADGAYALR